jgi:hypothetical protein
LKRWNIDQHDSTPSQAALPDIAWDDRLLD